MSLRKVGPTKIVCTLGPSSWDEAVIRKMIDNGMGVARVNFSHGDRELHRKVFGILNKIREEEKYATLAVAVDTKGPEIRIGSFPRGPVEVKVGARVVFSTDAIYKENSSQEHVYIDYPQILQEIEESQVKNIYIDDGKLKLKVIAVDRERKEISTEALTAYALSSKKGVNIPGASISLPGVTAQDKEDIAFGAENGADFVFASFIRSAANLKEIRTVIGAEKMKIVAKIECNEALVNIEEIVEEADGVMIARGDLGIEIDYASLFFTQCKISHLCVEMGKPFIVATQMLESMTESSRPTRAEVTDVGFACMSMAGCTMLSGETAAGKDPVNVVSAMRRILLETAEQFSEYHNKSNTGIYCSAKNPYTIEVLVSSNKRELRAYQIVHGVHVIYSTDPESLREFPKIPLGYSNTIRKI